MSINFFSSSEDSDENRNLRTKINNIEIMMGNETDKIIDELFESFLQNYQKDLEASMRGSEFNFDSVDLLYYHLQKISLKRSRSYKDSPEWPKNKKATIKPENNDGNCLQYALTIALNYQNIKSHQDKISKIKPFINQYDWKDTNFPTHFKDWKKIELNNETVALHILFAPYNTEKVRLVYKSKNNFRCKIKSFCY